LPAAVLALSATASPAAAQAPLVIDADRAGVNAIGPFAVAQNPKVDAATAVFGAPTAVQEGGRGISCTVRWDSVGLTVVFGNLGGGGSACQVGAAQAAVAAGPGWQTAAGLPIGGSVAQLRQLYPKAKRRGNSYWLFYERTPIADNRLMSILTARTAGGAVTSFKVWIGAAGE